MSTSNDGGTRPDTAMSNPSPITTASAHDTSNRGGGGGGGGHGRGRGRGRGNSYRGHGGIRSRETQRFQGREEGLRDTSTTYKHTSPLINTSKQHMK